MGERKQIRILLISKCFSILLVVSLLLAEDDMEFSLTTLSKRISERSSLEKECGAWARFSLQRGKIIDCN